MANISALLSSGIAAAQVGQRAQARALLTQVVQLDTHNEQAWLWLSGAEIGQVVVVTAIFAVLAAVNHRLFFGGRGRIATAVPARGSDEHFNTGIRYRDKGMWYLAAREWEASLVYGTADASYHRALGLCYVQLGEFGRAIRELRAALALEPADARLRDDLTTVEKAARQAGHRYAV